MYRLLLCLPLGFFLCLTTDQFDLPAAIKPSAPPVNPVADSGGPLPTDAQFEALAKSNPVAMLENCLRRYARDVKGYTLTLQKQERINGIIHPKEVIAVKYRGKPHSVFFEWKQGARLAERVLYVAGANDGKMLARPKGAVARLVAGEVVKRDPEGPDARKSGRYTLTEFGFRNSLARSLVAWKAAQENGTLQFEYMGIKKVKEAGDRPCYTIRRICKKLEDDGLKEVTLHIDVGTWMQTGVVLKDEKGLLIGAYYFRDLKLNPKLTNEEFQAAALKGK